MLILFGELGQFTLQYIDGCYQWRQLISDVCCGVKHMSMYSLVDAVAAIQYQNGSKLTLFEDARRRP